MIWLAKGGPFLQHLHVWQIAEDLHSGGLESSPVSQSQTAFSRLRLLATFFGGVET